MNANKFTILGIGLSMCWSVTSPAVPLLREGAADFSEEIVTIYPDHSDPNLAYFLPNTGSFAKGPTGKPLVSLTTKDLTHSDPNKGMGWWTATLEAGLTPEVKKELKSYKSAHPNVRLSVVPFGKSAITLGDPFAVNPQNSPEAESLIPDPDKKPPTAMVSSQPTLANLGLDGIFKNIFLPPHAGVAESQVGFNAVLTRDGAELFETAITGLNPINMFLCFQVYGALPTMHAKITMNYQMIYEYFQASASGGWLWWGWSVSRVTEKLIEDKAIKIEILGGDATMEDYVKMIAKELMDTYLQPKLTASPGSVGSKYSPTSLVVFGANSVYKEQRTSATWEMKKQVFITDDRCIALPMGDLSSWKNEIIKRAN